MAYFFRPHHGPGVDSAPSENEYQEHFLGLKAAGAWGWRPYHLHVPNVMKIWEPKSHGTLWATPGLLRDSFTFTQCAENIGNINIIAAFELTITEWRKQKIGGCFGEKDHRWAKRRKGGTRMKRGNEKRKCSGWKNREESKKVRKNWRIKMWWLCEWFRGFHGRQVKTWQLMTGRVEAVIPDYDIIGRFRNWDALVKVVRNPSDTFPPTPSTVSTLLQRDLRFLCWGLSLIDVSHYRLLLQGRK